MTITPQELERKRNLSYDEPGLTRPMTYEEYLASPEEMRRYDIIDGWKIYRTYGEKRLPNPTRRHQIVQGNLYVALRAYALASGHCRAVLSPCDVLITEEPARFRQPDILVISNDRWQKNLPSDDPAPLSPAPEMVVEIISPSESVSSLADKVRDYASVDVAEIWIVRPDKESVEVRRLGTGNGHASTSGKSTRTARSKVFDGLSVPLEVIFAG